MLCKGKLLLFAPLLFLFFTTVVSQAQTLYPPHSGQSPVAFDSIAKPGSSFSVSDRQPGVLDEYLFRDNNEFQIEIEIPIERYVGSVSTAIANGIISETAQIYIPAYDIDAYTSPTFDCDGDGDGESETFNPEVNEVYLNGQLIGALDGDDRIWKFNDTFHI
jgi:hypothetical protein